MLSNWAKVIVALVSLGCFTEAGLPATQSPANPLVIIFADVGQGDAVLIITPEQKRVLIDAGPSHLGMERLFAEAGYDTLDLLIASHNHADHIGGMPWVFNRFVVRAYMDNGIPHTTSAYRRILFAAEREPGLQYFQATERTVKLGSVTLRIIPPARLDASQNNNSVGVVLEHGSFRAMFTGDSQHEQLTHWLRGSSIPRVDVLKAAHHGSANGATVEWIAATNPKTVVISASRTNSFGHPSPQVVRAWQLAGASVYRTDVEGSIMVAVQPNGKHTVHSNRSVQSRRLPR
jgi:competence protein ComEC